MAVPLLSGLRVPSMIHYYCLAKARVDNHSDCLHFAKESKGDVTPLLASMSHLTIIDFFELQD